MHSEVQWPPTQIRYDWTREELRDIYQRPIPELLFQAQQIHRQHHKSDEVQLCKLLSIKTGGCPEDCAY
jgi:biotin synthase